jgi:hydrogenase-4 component E
MIPYFQDLSTIMMALLLVTGAIIIVKRDIFSLIKTYSTQSLILAILAGLFYFETGSLTLLVLASIIVVSKMIIIPHFMGHIQQKLNIKRDVEFHFLTPQKALFASIFIILFVYVSFSRLLSELNIYSSNLFFLGATVGVSLVFMGMIVIFTRKQTITNIVGYLTMENGVVLFSFFLAELPLMVEILIIVDLIILTQLATILAFGIDSSIEEFHARLNPFHKPRIPFFSESKDDDSITDKDEGSEQKFDEDD